MRSTVASLRDPQPTGARATNKNTLTLNDAASHVAPMSLDFSTRPPVSPFTHSCKNSMKSRWRGNKLVGARVARIKSLTPIFDKFDRACPVVFDCSDDVSWRANQVLVASRAVEPDSVV